MAFRPLHEIHARRSGRNRAVGLILCAFVVLMFFLTYVKLTSGGDLEGFDHSPPSSRMIQE